MAPAACRVHEKFADDKQRHWPGTSKWNKWRMDLAATRGVMKNALSGSPGRGSARLDTGALTVPQQVLVAGPAGTLGLSLASTNPRFRLVTRSSPVGRNREPIEEEEDMEQIPRPGSLAWMCNRDEVG